MSGKTVHDLEIEGVLEGDNAVGKLGEGQPLPGGVFGNGSGDGDLVVGSGVAVEGPFLALTEKPSIPELRDEFPREVIIEPVIAGGDVLDKVGRDSRLLLKLAQGGGGGILARIYAALGHLPGLLGAVDAVANEDAAVGIGEHDADTGPVEGRIVTMGERRGHGGRLDRIGGSGLQHGETAQDVKSGGKLGVGTDEFLATDLFLDTLFGLFDLLIALNGLKTVGEV